MALIDPSIYGSAIAPLLNGFLPAPLDAGAPNEKLRPALAALTPENLFTPAGKAVRDLRMARCCLAGLWLRHNFFDESHALSQEIETPTGSFWHAILHRREPDYGNARYWFRRTGQHPIFTELNDAAIAAGWPRQPHWDAYLFVDKVEAALSKGPENSAARLCRTAQQLEWELLFDFCWQQALA